MPIADFIIASSGNGLLICTDKGTEIKMVLDSAAAKPQIAFHGVSMCCSQRY